MSSHYCDGTEEFYEQCPKCGHVWEGECPVEPWWAEYYCTHCDYGEGVNTYTDEKTVIVEGNIELQRDNPLRKESMP